MGPRSRGLGGAPARQRLRLRLRVKYRPFALSNPLLAKLPAVHALADELAARGCEVSHAEITASVFPLYAVSATDAERQAVRDKLTTWADWLDQLDTEAESLDACRRAGAAPVTF